MKILYLFENTKMVIKEQKEDLITTCAIDFEDQSVWSTYQHVMSNFRMSYGKNYIFLRSDL